MSNHFRASIRDYRTLKERGYPDKASLKLVADRYRLNSQTRNCLFRGVVAPAVSRSRGKKLLSAAKLRRARLGVDWYNVLITVESYLKGYPVFVADDGVLRDSAGVHGSYRPGRVTEPAIRVILDSLGNLGLAGVDIYLDAPISNSGKMARDLRERNAFRPPAPAVTVSVELSADYPLKRYSGVVATSDSAIMDSENVGLIFDLACFVLRKHYRHTPVRLEDLPGS